MPDKRNKSTEFLMQTLPELINSELNCHTLGRVLRYDKTAKTCDVQILPLQSDGEKRAALTSVIVPDSISMINDIVDFMKWADKFVDTYNSHTNPPGGGVSASYTHFDKDKENHAFKVGSVVLIGFLDRDSDNFNGSGNNFKIETRRMHSLQDAFVGGVIKP